MQRRDSFFGRRKGKRLRPGQAELLRDRLPSLLIDIAVPPPPRLEALFAVPVERVWLEIGFGGGEHLIHRALNHPEAGIIGIEPFVNGLAKALRAIDRHHLGNVRLYDQDAGPLLDWMPAESLERIDLLYPDPWPKRRHWKRRFVNRQNLDRIARVLRPGGAFRFISDIPSYVDWTLIEVSRHGGLEWTARSAEDWQEPWPGWPGTRYEAKAIREGRRPAYLTFRKPDGGPDRVQFGSGAISTSSASRLPQ
jgi:tRNA (guanine-N7-)-methyltransferase